MGFTNQFRGLQELKELNSIVDAAIEGEVEEDEDKLIAERRARRQAILEKHQKQKEQTGERLSMFHRGLRFLSDLYVQALSTSRPFEAGACLKTVELTEFFCLIQQF
jgi:hypothetical protein